MENEMKEFVIKAGTTVGINGVPVELKKDTVVLSATPLNKILATRKAIIPQPKKPKQ